MATHNQTQEVHLRITNRFPREATFVLEPWGEEHRFPANDVIEVIANGPVPGSLDLDVTEDVIAVWAWAGSTVFLFRDGVEFAGASNVRESLSMDTRRASRL